MIPAAKRAAAVFDDAETPALPAVLGTEMLKLDHTVRDALDVQVMIGRRHVVEQHHRATAAGKELLECQDLPPVA